MRIRITKDQKLSNQETRDQMFNVPDDVDTWSKTKTKISGPGNHKPEISET